MTRKRTLTRFLTAAMALATFACATTTFQSTWRDPEARPLRLTGRKVVGLFVCKDPVRRRRAEDALAREISARGAQGAPSCTALSDEEIKDQEAVRTKLDRLGFSGVVVMRVVGRQTQYTVVQPAFWGSPHHRVLREIW